MKSNYKKLGDFIQQVKKRNNDNILTVDNLRGINISKEFMPSVANVTGTDLSVYKVVEKNQFAYNPMHVGRDEVLPISMLVNEDKVIVSPAYVIFEIVDTDKLLSEYLMIWCRRREFDRNAWFTTDSSVRGGFNWEDFCDLELPVPSLEKQKEIIKEYHIITDRIKLNEQVNQKLEDIAQSIYKEWFVNFEFPDENAKPYKSNGGEMVYCEELEMEIPKRWNSGILENIGEIVGGATPSKDNLDYWDNEGIIWITPKDLSKENNKFIYQGEYKISELGYKKSSTKIMPKNSVLFSSRAPIGYLAINMNQLCTNQGFKSIIPKKEIGTEFVYYYLKFNTENIAKESTGSTFAEVSGTMMKNYKALIPDKITCLNFTTLVKKIFNQQILIEKEINIENRLLSILLSKIATIEE